MRIGIVGSRRRSSLSDRKIIFDIVARAIKKSGGDLTVVSGGASGPDSFAEEAADILGAKKTIHRIPKDPPVKHRGEFTERAYARNRLIVEDSDVIFALIHHTRTGGTENTIKHANELGKKVFLVQDDGRIYL